MIQGWPIPVTLSICKSIEELSLDKIYKVRCDGLSLAQVASGCYDGIDAGPAWMKGYHDAQRDFQGLNGHGFDDST